MIELAPVQYGRQAAKRDARREVADFGLPSALPVNLRRVCRVAVYRDRRPQPSGADSAGPAPSVGERVAQEDRVLAVGAGREQCDWSFNKLF
jgi:hypothetical protein